MDWSRVLETVLAAILFPGFLWGLKTVLEIKTVLVGTDGQNGIRSDVKDLKGKMEDVRTRVAVLERNDPHHSREVA